MEYVLNHNSDTSGPPDRRARPQSAFIPTQSYYSQRQDDVGRPVLQHRPLAKGEFTQSSLAKVFDDPGMRPKVFVAEAVNKVSYGLMSRDVEGAAPRPKDLPRKVRDTDPNAPAYVLPGAAATAAAAAAAAAAQPAPARSGRTAGLDVSDINAVQSVVERPAKLATRGGALNVGDIEGAWPGWEPPFRAHVGRNLRDPGLNVQDISGPGGGLPSEMRKAARRPVSALPAAGGRRSGDSSGWYGGWQAAQQSQQPAQQQQHPYQQHQHAWSAATAPQPSQQTREQQQQPERSADGDALQQSRQRPQRPLSATLPLRPAIPPPPYATTIASAGMAAALGGAAADRRMVAAAELPSATVGRPSRADPASRHAAKRAAADAQLAAAAAAEAAVAGMRPSKEAVEAFWASCRAMDRETCGKVTPEHLRYALERAQLGAGGGGPGGGGGAEAEVLTRGYQDGSGMVPYRHLARALLGQAMGGGGSGGDAQRGPTRGSGVPRPASAGLSRCASASSASPATGTARPALRSASSGSGTGGGGGLEGVEAPAPARRSVVWAQEVAAVPSSAASSGGAATSQHQHQKPAPSYAAASAVSITDGAHTRTPHATHQGSPTPHSLPPRAPSPAASSSPPAAAAPATTSSPNPAAPGPSWPPAPPEEPPMRRPAAAIAAASGVPLREACDTVYYPYKANPYWFAGNSPAAEGASSVGEAAREYQPSADPTSSIVGKGHNRITVAGSGEPLLVPLPADSVAAGMEAARRYRPYSAASGREAEARGGSAAGGLRQLQQDGPPLYAADYEPGGSAGSTLRYGGGAAAAATTTAGGVSVSGPGAGGVMSILASSGRQQPLHQPLQQPAAGASGYGQGAAGRPASAPRGAARGGAGGGGPRVGMAALERQIMREAIAAVRDLR